MKISFFWKVKHDNFTLISFFEEVFNGKSLVDWRKKVFHIISLEVYTLKVSKKSFLHFFMPVAKSFRK